MISENRVRTINQIRDFGQSFQKLALSIQPELINVKPADGGWSIQEIAAHSSNAVMLAYGLRIRRLMCEADPVFADYDEGSELLEELDKEGPLAQTVTILRAEHNLVADLLELLPESGWKRSGTHPESGILTVEFVAQRIAAHAEEHQAQVRETVQRLN